MSYLLVLLDGITEVIRHAGKIILVFCFSLCVAISWTTMLHFVTHFGKVLLHHPIETCMGATTYSINYVNA